MSTKTERASRARRQILPIKVQVRQRDGHHITQIVDVDVRSPKRRDRTPTASKAIAESASEG